MANREVNARWQPGLSFNLNYKRPRYFAFEAMPIVTHLATRFGLSVVDPQADWDDPPQTRVADTEPW